MAGASLGISHGLGPVFSLVLLAASGSAAEAKTTAGRSAADFARPIAVHDLMGADPTRSHFFNTDCVSCHTETCRAIDLPHVKSVAGVDNAVLPKDVWNVRNFGWFPSFPAARETAAVLQFIKANGLLK